MGFALVAFNKSGVAVKKQLYAGACVVDCGYQGEVHINLTNVGKEEQYIKPGDKIIQFVLLFSGRYLMISSAQANVICSAKAISVRLI